MAKNNSRKEIYLNNEKMVSYNQGETYIGNKGGKIERGLFGYFIYSTVSPETGRGLIGGICALLIMCIGLSLFFIKVKAIIVFIPVIIGMGILIFLHSRCGAGLAMSVALFLFMKYSSEMTILAQDSDFGALNAFTFIGCFIVAIVLNFVLFNDHPLLAVYNIIGDGIIIGAGFTGSPGLFSYGVWGIFTIETILEFIGLYAKKSTTTRRQVFIIFGLIIVIALGTGFNWYHKKTTIGSHIDYKFSESTGTLTIFGQGATYDYPRAMFQGHMQYWAPWTYDPNFKVMMVNFEPRDVHRIVIEEGVTHLGDSLFISTNFLVKEVVIPTTMDQDSFKELEFIKTLERVYIPEDMVIPEYENLTSNGVEIIRYSPNFE